MTDTDTDTDMCPERPFKGVMHKIDERLNQAAAVIEAIPQHASKEQYMHAVSRAHRITSTGCDYYNEVLGYFTWYNQHGTGDTIAGELRFDCLADLGFYASVRPTSRELHDIVTHGKTVQITSLRGAASRCGKNPSTMVWQLTADKDVLCTAWDIKNPEFQMRFTWHDLPSE